MKLLLTSKGLRNETLRQVLRTLVGEEEISVAFIPTAANIVDSDKHWLVRDLSDARAMGRLDIIEIAALREADWRPRLEKANVILFGGGNAVYLMHWLNATGLAKALPELLTSRVYVGISAGSIVACPTLAATSPEKVDEARKRSIAVQAGLGLVPFWLRPHYNAPGWANATSVATAELSKTIPGVLYGVDDESALQVIDGKVMVVGEGRCEKYEHGALR